MLAQTSYVDVCRTEMNAASDKPFEFLMAKSKLTDALCQYDLGQAFTNSKEALEFAEALGETNGVVLATLQMETIQSLRTSKKSIGFDESKFSLNNEATPEQRVLFFTTLIDSLNWSRTQNAKFASYVESARAAASTCRDPHVKFRLKSSELYYRWVLLGEPPTSPDVVVLHNSLKEGARRYPFLDCQIAIRLLEAEISRRQKDPERRFAAMELAFTEATRLNNTRYISLCQISFGNLCLNSKDVNKEDVH